MDENGSEITVSFAARDGRWRRIYHRETALFVHAIPTAQGIELILKPGTSEAWADRDAQTYDPYEVWRVAPGRVRYDLVASRHYTEAHYCAWAGPNYDERYGAIGPTTGKDKYHVITRTEFEARNAREQ
jgi:hypothetical protein